MLTSWLISAKFFYNFENSPNMEPTFDCAWQLMEFPVLITMVVGNKFWWLQFLLVIGFVWIIESCDLLSITCIKNLIQGKILPFSNRLNFESKTLNPKNSFYLSSTKILIEIPDWHFTFVWTMTASNLLNEKEWQLFCNVISN